MQHTRRVSTSGWETGCVVRERPSAWQEQYHVNLLAAMQQTHQLRGGIQHHLQQASLNLGAHNLQGWRSGGEETGIGGADMA